MKSMKLFPRTVARLAGVQAVFQGLLRPSLVCEEIIKDFLAHRFQGQHYPLSGNTDMRVDCDFFSTLIEGVFLNKKMLQDKIKLILPDDWSLDRMENTTHAILLCACFEMVYCPDTPKAVVLNEYVLLGHLFLLDKGHKLINRLLENLYENHQSSLPSPSTLSQES